jgi:hypothetical protein
MEYKDFFSPATLEKLNKKSAENLKAMIGDKNLMQTMMSSQQLLSQIAKAETPYKQQLEKLAVNMVKELYPIIDQEGIVLDAKIGSIADVGSELDEIKVNTPRAFLPGEKVRYDKTIVRLSKNPDRYSKEENGKIHYLIDDPKTGQRFYTTDKYIKRLPIKENISPESRRRIINAITQGAALRGAFAFYLFKEHLDEIDPSLVEKYNQIMKNSFGIYDDENAIAMMLSLLAQGQKVAGGSSKVIVKEIKVLNPGSFETLKRNLIKLIEWDKIHIFPNDEFQLEEADETIRDIKTAENEEDLKNAISYYTSGEPSYYLNLASFKDKVNNPLLMKELNEAESGITIRARAINFPMLVHELIKGLYELISLQGFKGDKASNQAVVDKVDLLKNEPSDIRYGKFIFDALNDVFVNSNYDDPRIREFFFQEVYQLDDTDFISLIENAINDQLTPSQKRWVESTLKNISIDLRDDDYDATGLDEIKVKKPSIDPKILSLINFKNNLRKVTNKEISPLNLILGKYNLSGNEQGVELSWEEGSKLVSPTTKANSLKLFNDLLGIDPIKIYIGGVHREEKVVKSFYIYGEYNNVPLVIARKETLSPQAGQTYLVSPTFKGKLNDYLKYTNLDNKTLKQSIIKDFNLGGVNEIKVKSPTRTNLTPNQVKVVQSLLPTLLQSMKDSDYGYVLISSNRNWEAGYRKREDGKYTKHDTNNPVIVDIIYTMREKLWTSLDPPDGAFLLISQNGDMYTGEKARRFYFRQEFEEPIKKTIKEGVLKEYSEKTITTTIKRWKKDNPEIKDSIARQVIQRFDQIKSGLPQKLNIAVLPDELKQGQNYLNIDKYSYNDMVTLLRSLPESEDKIKKDAVKKFVEEDKLDKQGVQRYISRFMFNRERLKLATKQGLEDQGFTKEDILRYIPRNLQQRDAFMDPRNWDWGSLEQMLDAVFPSQNTTDIDIENLATTDADKVYNSNGIEIYKGDDIQKCISYNPVSTQTKRKKYGWCVTQVGNPNYDYYRFKDTAPTFYFVFDRSKDSSPEHAPFNDKWHAFVIQVTADLKTYLVTDADNRRDIPTRPGEGWEGISKIVPADTWDKLKNLKEYFKPIALSPLERSRKFAAGKNLTVEEFKELTQDEKIEYIKGKASTNNLTVDILRILPEYRLKYDGRTTTLANIAIDTGQSFPYEVLKDNEPLAKRYAVFKARHEQFGAAPLPLPFVKYLEEKDKEEYLKKFDDNLTFEYIEKYFGEEITKEYVETQLKTLKYLPLQASKYIENPKLKQLFETYSKLFSSWRDGTNTNIDDQRLNSVLTMPEQNVTPVPINQEQWSNLTTSERGVIIELAEKFNQNLEYDHLLYGLPYIIKDGAKKYILLPTTNNTDLYEDWVLIEPTGKVVKADISGESTIGDDSLIVGFPSTLTNLNRIYNIEDLKIQ